MAASFRTFYGKIWVGFRSKDTIKAYFWLSVMSNRETEWGECTESGWECGECGEWGGNAGNKGGNAGNQGGNSDSQHSHPDSPHSSSFPSFRSPIPHPAFTDSRYDTK